MTQTITETIGVDLGDKYSNYCVLDQESGEPTTVPNRYQNHHNIDQLVPVVRTAGAPSAPLQEVEAGADNPCGLICVFGLVDDADPVEAAEPLRP